MFIYNDMWVFFEHRIVDNHLKFFVDLFLSKAPSFQNWRRKAIRGPWVHMVVSWNRGTPSYHPFIDGIFHCKPSSYWGIPTNGNPHMVLVPIRVQVAAPNVDPQRQLSRSRMRGVSTDPKPTKIAGVPCFSKRRRPGNNRNSCFKHRTFKNNLSRRLAKRHPNLW